MPVKKQKANIVDEDCITISNSGLDLSNFIMDSMDANTVTLPYTWDQNYGNVVSSNTITIAEEGDIKIGDRSLKDFIDRVEERLAILRPNQELEDRWEQLKNLRRQYQDLEQEILKKEKMWSILKK